MVITLLIVKGCWFAGYHRSTGVIHVPTKNQRTIVDL